MENVEKNKGWYYEIEVNIKTKVRFSSDLLQDREVVISCHNQLEEVVYSLEQYNDKHASSHEVKTMFTNGKTGYFIGNGCSDPKEEMKVLKDLGYPIDDLELID